MVFEATRMGRKPIIREAILNVLKKSNTPLRFKEIREAVADELGRDKEEVRDQNISDNLSILVERGKFRKQASKVRMYIAHQTHSIRQKIR